MLARGEHPKSERHAFFPAPFRIRRTEDRPSHPEFQRAFGNRFAKILDEHLAVFDHELADAKIRNARRAGLGRGCRLRGRGRESFQSIRRNLKRWRSNAKLIEIEFLCVGLRELQFDSAHAPE